MRGPLNRGARGLGPARPTLTAALTRTTTEYTISLLFLIPLDIIRAYRNIVCPSILMSFKYILKNIFYLLWTFSDILSFFERANFSCFPRWNSYSKIRYCIVFLNAMTTAKQLHYGHLLYYSQDYDDTRVLLEWCMWFYSPPVQKHGLKRPKTATNTGHLYGSVSIKGDSIRD